MRRYGRMVRPVEAEVIRRERECSYERRQRIKRAYEIFPLPDEREREAERRLLLALLASGEFRKTEELSLRR